VRRVTLCFLVRGAPGRIEAVCLGMKKRGFGVAKWAGIGGKVGDEPARRGETAEAAARRELREEVLVDARALAKVAEVAFRFPHRPAWDQVAHAYLVWDWAGEPTETDEMRPRWFTPEEIPYDQMWDDGRYWLPRVLAGERLRAHFCFGPQDTVADVTMHPLADTDDSTS
jgi:ADP-ribose pyrophosphatase YjhB (NUDIX family)